MSVDRETRDWYDANVARYDAIAGPSAAQRSQFDRFAAALPAGGAALDLGCGTGWASALLTAAGLRVEAWDPSPAMVEATRAASGAEGFVRSAADLDGPARFDGVWASFSLLHLPDEPALRAAFAAVARALRPGGVFYSAFKGGPEAGIATRRDALGRAYLDLSRPAYEALLAEAGFDVLWLEGDRALGADGVTTPTWAALARLR